MTRRIDLAKLEAWLAPADVEPGAARCGIDYCDRRALASGYCSEYHELIAWDATHGRTGHETRCPCEACQRWRVAVHARPRPVCQRCEDRGLVPVEDANGEYGDEPCSCAAGAHLETQLWRVHDTLRQLSQECETLRAECQHVLATLHAARFPTVLCGCGHYELPEKLQRRGAETVCGACGRRAK